MAKFDGDGELREGKEKFHINKLFSEQYFFVLMKDDAFFQRTIRIVESSNRRLSNAQIWKEEKQKGYANSKHSARWFRAKRDGTMIFRIIGMWRNLVYNNVIFRIESASL